MNLTLQILGAASAMPVSDMNPSAQALNVHGRLFLIDCGEGAQQRMRQMHISFLKVEAVFISHIHGDHMFGLFGLLSTMAMYNRTEVLHLFGPRSLGPVLKFYLSYFGEGMNFEVDFHSVEPDSLEEIYSNRYVRVSAFPLQHKIETVGYRFSDYYAYCSDTKPFEALKDYVKDVHVLYHETTYLKSYADKAVQRFHSTTADAAGLALQAGVGRLLVGHYSSRDRNHLLYENECREIFPNTTAVKDGDVIEID